MAKYIFALDENGNRVHIDDAVRSGKNYTCCFCHEKMIPRKGEKRVHHFAHASNCDCDMWYGNKGEWHRSMQDLFPKECQEVIVEKDGERHIADVCLPRPDGTKLIVEFQHSDISREEVLRRTLFWNSGDTELIWVFDIRDKDVRLVPQKFGQRKIYEGDEIYRWMRPKNSLNDPKIKMRHVTTILEILPQEKTRWIPCSKEHAWCAENQYSVSEGRRLYYPFYLVDDGTDDISFHVGGETVRYNGYQFLKGEPLGNERILADYIKARANKPSARNNQARLDLTTGRMEFNGVMIGPRSVFRDVVAGCPLTEGSVKLANPVCCNEIDMYVEIFFSDHGKNTIDIKPVSIEYAKTETLNVCRTWLRGITIGDYETGPDYIDGRYDWGSIHCSDCYDEGISIYYW